MIDPGQSDDREEPEELDDPFAVFTEWASGADDRAYADLAKDPQKPN